MIYIKHVAIALNANWHPGLTALEYSAPTTLPAQ